MESLKDILINKNLDEPTEISALRKYYIELFDEIPELQISGDYLVVYVPNSKIASELRLRMPEITRRCQPTKKLFIKVRVTKSRQTKM